MNIRALSFIGKRRQRLRVIALLLLKMRTRSTLLLRALTRSSLNNSIHRTMTNKLKRRKRNTKEAKIRLSSRRIIILVRSRLSIMRTRGTRARTRLLNMLRSSTLRLIQSERNKVRTSEITKIGTNTLRRLRSTKSRRVLTITSNISLCLFTLRMLVRRRKLILISFRDNLRMLARILVLNRSLRNATARRGAKARRREMTGLINNNSTILSINRHLTLKLKGIRLPRGFLRTITILHPISNLTINTSSLSPTIGRKLNRISNHLTARENRRTLKVLGIRGNRRVFKNRKLRMRLIHHNMINKRHLKIIISSGKLMTKLTSNLRHISNKVIGFRTLTSTSETNTRRRSFLLVHRTKIILTNMK